MTLQVFNGNIIIPDQLMVNTDAYASLLDADGEEQCWVFRIPKTGTISKIGYYVSDFTQCTNGLSVGMETVDAATGYPSGTAYGGMVAGTQAVTGTGWFWTALGTGASAVLNNIASIVIKINSFQAGDNLSIRYMAETITPQAPGDPYAIDYLGGVWTKHPYFPTFGIEYDDGSITFVRNVLPLSAFATVSFNSGSTPDRRGIRFKFPFSMTANGVWVQGYNADFNVLLYDSDGTTVLETLSFDKDIRSTNSYPLFFAFFSTPRTFIINTFYRLVLLPTTVTDTRLMYGSVTNDGANLAMKAFPFGDNIHGTYCSGAPANEASWTQELTRRYNLGLLASAFDDGAGGAGGLLTHPGMSGGMRG